MGEKLEALVSPNSIIDPDTARQHIQRSSATDEDELVRAINFATAVMEAVTRRRLRERLYLLQFAVTGVSVTKDDTSATGAAFPAIRDGSDLFNAKLRIGTRVRGTATSTTIPMSRAAAETAAAQSFTVGSAPMTWRHHGGGEYMLLEHPVEEVYAMNRLEHDGSKVALDLSQVRLDKAAGVLEIYSDGAGAGEWIEAECRAGYRPRTETDMGHDEAWFRLEQLALRCVQVLFQDHKQLLGRTTEMNLGAQSLRMFSLKLPEDVREGLAEFEREHA